MTNRSSAATTEHLDRPNSEAGSSTGSFVDFGRSTDGRTAASCIDLAADIAATMGHLR